LRPSGELMVHGVGEFLEGSVEGQWLPAFSAVQRQAVGTSAEWVSRNLGSAPYSSVRPTINCPPRAVTVRPRVTSPASSSVCSVGTTVGKHSLALLPASSDTGSAGGGGDGCGRFDAPH
jgi:hypothetical protein